jgi:hypothetical protein
MTPDAAMQPPEVVQMDKHIGEIASIAAAGGVVSWLIQRILGQGDTSKKDQDALKAEIEKTCATLRADVERISARVGVLEQQVSGAGLGLITVVGRLASAVERLDTVVTRIDARMEAAE